MLILGTGLDFYYYQDLFLHDSEFFIVIKYQVFRTTLTIDRKAYWAK